MLLVRLRGRLLTISIVPIAAIPVPYIRLATFVPRERHCRSSFGVLPVGLVGISDIDNTTLLVDYSRRDGDGG